MESNNIDTKTQTLLEHKEEEFENLMKDYHIYTKLTDELDRELSYPCKINASNIKQKLNKIQNKIKQMNLQIKYLKNFIKDNQPKKYQKLVTISDNIINKYGNINLKFNQLLEKENTDTSSSDYNHQAQKQVLIDKSSYNTNAKIQSLLEVQKEYQTIFQITQELSQITKEMKESSLRQNKKINTISDSIIDVNSNASKAKDEVIKLQHKENQTSKGYLIAAIISVIIFFCICGWLYFYVFNTSSDESTIVA